MPIAADTQGLAYSLLISGCTVLLMTVGTPLCKRFSFFYKTAYFYTDTDS